MFFKYLQDDIIPKSSLIIPFSVLTCDTPEALLDGTNPVPDTYFTAAGYGVPVPYHTSIVCLHPINGLRTGQPILSSCTLNLQKCYCSTYM